MSCGLLVTRPAHQAERLAELATDARWTPIRLPLFDIADVEDADTRRQRLADLRDADCWLFTSTNAVDAVVRAAPEIWAPTAAIGAATAEALVAAGQPPLVVPSARYDSEALLALSPFDAPDGRHIVLIGNETGRDVLASTLRTRGAQVTEYAVYRLLPIAHAPEFVGRALAQSDVVLLTSARAIDQLIAICPEPERARVRGLPFVAPSQRVVDHARRCGLLGEAVIAQPMSNYALLRAADTLRVMEDSEKTKDTEVATSSEGVTSTTSRTAAGGDANVRQPASAGAPGAPASPGTSSGAASAPPPRRSFAGRLLAVLLIVVVFIAIAGAGWWGWQFAEQVVASQNARIVALEDTLAKQQSALRTAVQNAREAEQSASAIAPLQRSVAEVDRRLEASVERIEAGESKIAEMADIIDAGRMQSHLVATEQLLLQANERLQLARDVRGAMQALRAADARMAAIDDPRFFVVRETIARELTSLSGIDQADRTAVALTLSALISSASDLRLRGGLPDASAPELVGAAPGGHSEGSSIGAIWERVRAAMASVFVIRRTDVPVEPLMGPQQAALVRDVLLLRLESARAAVVGGDARAFQQAIDDSRAWLKTHFDPDNTAVAGAMRELEHLSGVALAPQLPEISGSLQQLRQRMAGMREAR